MELDLFSAAFWIAVGQIILIDIVLSGDNAVVIALACRNLAPEQRRQGVFWGVTGGGRLVGCVGENRPGEWGKTLGGPHRPASSVGGVVDRQRALRNDRVSMSPPTQIERTWILRRPSKTTGDNSLMVSGMVRANRTLWHAHGRSSGIETQG